MTGIPARLSTERRLGSNNATHGMFHSSMYHRWQLMKRRCECVDSLYYSNYGGRGIRVCERWQDFTKFYADMGDPPGPGYSIDRINNYGDYEPMNCRWATRSEQSRNTRRNRFITHAGKTQCVTDWAAEIGVSQSTLDHRLKRGYSVAESLAPKVKRKPGCQTKDISGTRYGMLVAVRYSHTYSKVAFWVFHCDCGKEVVRRACSVRSLSRSSTCGSYACRKVLRELCC